MSFNYDSLLEQVLLQRGLWNPEDGFGVAVEIGKPPMISEHNPSKNLVLHLHGSVLLYAEEFSWRRKANDDTLWMEERPEPKFLFDPHSLGPCFPFDRAAPMLGYRRPEERIIVPIRNKSEALHESYVKVVYSRAHELLRTAGQVIALGYRFAGCDRSSFDSLLQIVSHTQNPLWIIAPDATDTSTRLRQMHPSLVTNPVAMTFEKWADSGFNVPP